MDSVSVYIDAPPERVWPLVSDITQMGRWSPENLGGVWTGGAVGPAVGARFKGRNRRGLARWTTHCKVVECVPPEAFAFEVRESRMRWRYVLEPEDGGTRLTETRGHLRKVSPPIRLVQRSGIIGRDRERLMVDGMRATLDRMKAAAEAPS